MKQSERGRVHEVSVVNVNQEALARAHRLEGPRDGAGELGEIGRVGDPQYGPERPERNTCEARRPPDRECVPALGGCLFDRRTGEP